MDERQIKLISQSDVSVSFDAEDTVEVKPLFSKSKTILFKSAPPKANVLNPFKKKINK